MAGSAQSSSSRPGSTDKHTNSHSRWTNERGPLTATWASSMTVTSPRRSCGCVDTRAPILFPGRRSAPLRYPVALEILDPSPQPGVLDPDRIGRTPRALLAHRLERTTVTLLTPLRDERRVHTLTT